MEANYCCKLLKNEFSKRKLRNSLYSMRAFSRDLEIGSTSLSDLFAGKRKLSSKNVIKISTKLSLSPKEKNLLICEARGNKQTKAEIDTIQLQEDTFRLISEWYYMAILNMAKIKDNQATPLWISQRLGISEQDANTALDRLTRMKFIEVENNQIIRTSLPLSTTRDIPSSAIKKYHHSNLCLAQNALDTVDVKLREFTSITMAIDLNQLEKAKNILMSTKRKVAKLLESGNTTEIYTLSFQLFPLTQIQPRKEL